jgi:F420-dependent oxidoreductase-like protein
MALRFGLQIPNFTWPGGPPEMGARLAEIARAAEEAGFSSIWVMDHFLQIRVVGPPTLDMLDSYTTLGYLAGVTKTVHLGTLVTGITYRNVCHLGKIIATLDVLSGGRAVAGLGAAWFEREHRAYGWRFPPLGERYAILEDALRLLPLLWGPDNGPFEGKAISVPETICYPRPIQQPRPPIMVGGSGERRTLRLVARYADACNLFGDAPTVSHKLEVLSQHCDEVGRDLSEIEITQLSTVELAAATTSDNERGDRVWRGSVEQAIEHFDELAKAGVSTAIVNMPDLSSPGPIEHFAEVIAAFA